MRGMIRRRMAPSNSFVPSSLSHHQQGGGGGFRGLGKMGAHRLCGGDGISSSHGAKDGQMLVGRRPVNIQPLAADDFTYCLNEVAITPDLRRETPVS